MKTKKGFTLLELMVAMGIIAILAAMSVYGISIVQQSLRNTQRRKNLEDINLALNQYFESYGSYPLTSNNTFQLTVEGVSINGQTVVEFSGAGKAQSGETTSSGSAYCYIPVANGGSYQLGVDLEGTEWGFQLGDPTLADCTSNILGGS